MLLPDAPEEHEDIPHPEWVSAVAVLPRADGPGWVLSGSYDKCARVWGADGGLKALLAGHAEPITGAAWLAPRGPAAAGGGAALCVTSSKDFALRSFAGEGERWAPVFRYTGHEDSVQVRAEWLCLSMRMRNKLARVCARARVGLRVRVGACRRGRS